MCIYLPFYYGNAGPVVPVLNSTNYYFSSSANSKEQKNRTSKDPANTKFVGSFLFNIYIVVPSIYLCYNTNNNY
ncbi:hypothetical protein C7K38_11065 [Tetragenococcus osmophilus]|uniref:Uncharacterized protein n=1 Tax=Tetragenococcus osmophilus TaxID=526944 RepID=A0AA38CX87_9ENTE|nr:hypothetical protein C7K38_11065 [Tetragenococcus osmophilus]GMA54897.1 hypothetical protein GCM10025857_62540 [Alicyclobacillus contaminans]GMA71304.1 hypothetical protein GCM10025885_03530 [Tetragenococcus osmophilus]